MSSVFILSPADRQFVAITYPRGERVQYLKATSRVFPGSFTLLRQCAQKLLLCGRITLQGEPVLHGSFLGPHSRVFRFKI